RCSGMSVRSPTVREGMIGNEPSLTVGLLTLRTQLDTSFSQTAVVERASVLSSTESGGVILLLDRIVFYGLMTLMVLTAIPYGTVHPWSRAIFQCSVFALTLLWIVHGLLSGSWRVGNLRLILPIGALV